jgi:hypothetical protein
MRDWVLLRELDKLGRSFLRLPCLRPLGLFSVVGNCPHCKALKTIKNLKVYAVKKRVALKKAASSCAWRAVVSEFGQLRDSASRMLSGMKEKKVEIKQLSSV